MTVNSLPRSQAALRVLTAQAVRAQGCRHTATAARLAACADRLICLVRPLQHVHDGHHKLLLLPLPPPPPLLLLPSVWVPLMSCWLAGRAQRWRRLAAQPAAACDPQGWRDTAAHRAAEGKAQVCAPVRLRV